MKTGYENMFNRKNELTWKESLLGRETATSSSPSNSVELFNQFPEIVGRSQNMLKVLETVAKFAKADKSSVLILGESGTGKELIASAIHRLSPRTTKSFIPLNCSAIPEALLEAELFGYEKGAFTGADKRRDGVFTEANGGTIFLDEIGDMPSRLQAKLLRVLQERKFSRVGSSKLEETNVRIIAATNVNLEDAVKSGTFRLDLYYRLNVLPVELPPLRERGEDVVQLLDYFLTKANIDHAKADHCYFSSEIYSVLKAYHWPGNVRQLQNLVDRLVIFKEGGRLNLEDLPSEFMNPPGNGPSEGSFSKDSSTESQTPHREIAHKNLAFHSQSQAQNKHQFQARSHHDTQVHPHDGSLAESEADSSEPYRQPTLFDDRPDTFDWEDHSKSEPFRNLAQATFEGQKAESSGEVLRPISSDIVVNMLLPDGGINLANFIAELENNLILQALKVTDNNKNKAAKLLGMNRTTLVERIKKRKLAELKNPAKEL